MTINKNNYEAYFLDYHEGNLTPQEVADLLLFIEQHPELKYEFESFENVTLEDYSTPYFENKDVLKKEINQENIDEYFIKDVEGVITSTEKSLLHNYIKQHPHLSADLELYRKTKLSSDSSLVFENKNRLKEIPFVLASKKTSDIEELMIASLEGVLSIHEQAFLDSQLNADANLATEFNLYKKAVLSADTTIIYGDKDELKRTSRRAPFYYYVSAAAAILLLFGLFSIFNNDSVTPKYASKNATEITPVITNRSVLVSNDSDSNLEKDIVAEQNTDRVIKKKNRVPKQQNDSKKESIIIPSKLENQSDNAIAVNTIVVPDTEQKNNPKQSFDNNLAPKNTTTLALTESSKPDDYMSLKEMAVAKIKEKALDETVLDSQKKNGKMKKMSGWDLAQIVAKGISKITGKDVNVEPTYNDAGDVVAYALNAGKLSFSKAR